MGRIIKNMILFWGIVLAVISNTNSAFSLAIPSTTNPRIILNPVYQIHETEQYFYVCGSNAINYMQKAVIPSREGVCAKVSDEMINGYSGIVRFSKNWAIDTTWKIFADEDVLVWAFDFIDPVRIIIAYNSVKSEENGIIIADTSGKILSNFSEKNRNQNAFSSTFSRSLQLKTVNQILYRNGMIYIVGMFTDFYSQPFNEIIRCTIDGVVDTSFAKQFGSGTNGELYKIDFQSNGKIIVFGRFDNFNNLSCPKGVVRLNSDGSLDSAFNAKGIGFSGLVTSGCVLEDNSIIVGGRFKEYNGNNSISQGLCRLSPDGQYDNGFNLGGSGFLIDGFYPSRYIFEINSVKSTKAGNIIVCGTFEKYNNIRVSTGVLCLDQFGSIDYSLDYSQRSVLDSKLFAIKTVQGDYVICGAIVMDSTRKGIISIQVFSEYKGYITFYLYYLAAVAVVAVFVVLYFVFLRNKKFRSNLESDI